MTKSIIYDFLRFLMLPLSEIDQAIPKFGKIVDLGCGEGVIVKYLAKVESRKVVGIDNNFKRLQKPGKSNMQFNLGDIRNYPLKGFDAVIISDVLHHLNYQDQKNLLSKVSKSLKKGRILLIKEIDTTEFIRSRLSRFWDFIFYPKDQIYYTDSVILKKLLMKLGFNVVITRPSRFFPGSTTLYLCRKN